MLLIHIADGLTDAHLWAAITPPRTWIEDRRMCAEGELFRVFGMTFPFAEAQAGFAVLDRESPPFEYLLEVCYLRPYAARDEAHVVTAFEADERGWWEYGGTGE